MCFIELIIKNPYFCKKNNLKQIGKAFISPYCQRGILMDYISEGLTLEVARGDPLDRWRCFVRIDETLMKKFQIDVHSFVEIKSKNNAHTGAIAIRARGVDLKKPIARMNSQIRHNTEVDLGDQVHIRPIKTIFATKIVIAPESDQYRVTKLPKEEDLEFYPLCQGDQFFIKTRVNRFDNLELPIHTYDQTLIRMRVISTEPSGIVTIDDRTKISILPFPHIDFLGKSIFPDWHLKSELVQYGLGKLLIPLLRLFL